MKIITKPFLHKQYDFSCRKKLLTIIEHKGPGIHGPGPGTDRSDLVREFKNFASSGPSQP